MGLATCKLTKQDNSEEDGRVEVSSGLTQLGVAVVGFAPSGTRSPPAPSIRLRIKNATTEKAAW